MAAKEYLLTLPELVGETIRLRPPCPVGRGANGDSIELNTLNPNSFGRSFLAEAGPELVWTARTRVKDLGRLRELYGFHCGAIISPRMRGVLETEHIPNVEFIPLDIVQEKSGELLGQWWFVNVFNWRRVFDFSRSRVEYGEGFYQPITGLRQISRRFGERPVKSWTSLVVNPEETEDGLFLAEGPPERIWANVFVSRCLAEKINAALPKRRQLSFPRYWLDEGPGPNFDLTGYRYAGG